MSRAQADDEFKGATDRFLAWFKAGGGVFRDDLLEIQDLRDKDAGRGIIAKQDIPQDTTLFSIPRDLIISVETSELPGKLPEVFDAFVGGEGDDEKEPLDSWTSLILVMMYEHLQGDASHWKPYLDVLPHTFDTPIFWSEAELKELEGTCLTAEKVGKQQSDDMLRSRVVPVIEQNPAIFYTEGAPRSSSEELLDLAHRMGSIIMSYAFDLDNKDEESDNEEDGWVEDRDGTTPLGMVPMADILNANADFNAHVNHGDSLEVTSLRSTLPAGSEVLNYYGPLPTSELLRRYGYVTPEHARYDVAELSWSLVRAVLIEQLTVPEEVVSKVEAKLEENEKFEEYFIIERDSGDPDSEGQLTYSAQLREVSPELEEQVKAVFKGIKKQKPELFSEKRKRIDDYQTIVEKALIAKLATYSTSVEEDETLLKGDDLAERRRMAITVRLGEKRLLQEALALLQRNEEGEIKTQTGKKTKQSA
ncbi:SET domain-containing protein RMS1 [Alternaria rosae]|uniref:SET domain-containing protein RMS1 n=1 Tax=Alternaria rosae TaxID=1187941 RepID=UPI001E8D9C1C|nr:SET domain-containing protein RMS1 [Alternaria rosae]KAH6878527.1 SET domain-containing protein RMS1 [Alternaria rosae]